MLNAFSFTTETSFLVKCLLHKSDTVKGASPNFLLVFAIALQDTTDSQEEYNHFKMP